MCPVVDMYAPRPPKKSKWLFYVMINDDERAFLEADGRMVYSQDATCFVGTEDEAIAEGDRRADVWDATHSPCKKIVRQCVGCGE